MAWEYSEKTKQLFMDAVQGKPGTHLGEIEHPDGEGRHGSIVCGDALKFTFRVERNEDPLRDVIVEAKYLTFGCTSAIAASEALCELIEGKGLTPIEALRVTNQDIVDFLGGWPQQKVLCSVMGAEALEAAVVDWPCWKTYTSEFSVSGNSITGIRLSSVSLYRKSSPEALLTSAAKRINPIIRSISNPSRCFFGSSHGSRDRLAGHTSYKYSYTGRCC